MQRKIASIAEKKAFRSKYYQYIDSLCSVFRGAVTDSIFRVGCFAYVFAGIHNYGCRIDQAYRCYTPQAQSILEFVDKVYQNQSTEFKVTLARRIYFVFLNLQQVQANFASTKVCEVAPSISSSYGLLLRIK